MGNTCGNSQKAQKYSNNETPVVSAKTVATETEQRIAVAGTQCEILKPVMKCRSDYMLYNWCPCLAAPIYRTCSPLSVCHESPHFNSVTNVHRRRSSGSNNISSSISPQVSPVRKCRNFSPVPAFGDNRLNYQTDHTTGTIFTDNRQKSYQVFGKYGKHARTSADNNSDILFELPIDRSRGGMVYTFSNEECLNNPFVRAMSTMPQSLTQIPEHHLTHSAHSAVFGKGYQSCTPSPPINFKTKSFPTLSKTERSCLSRSMEQNSCIVKRWNSCVELSDFVHQDVRVDWSKYQDIKHLNSAMQPIRTEKSAEKRFPNSQENIIYDLRCGSHGDRVHFDEGSTRRGCEQTSGVFPRNDYRILTQDHIRHFMEESGGRYGSVIDYSCNNTNNVDRQCGNVTFIDRQNGYTILPFPEIGFCPRYHDERPTFWMDSSKMIYQPDTFNLCTNSMTTPPSSTKIARKVEHKVRSTLQWDRSKSSGETSIKSQTKQPSKEVFKYRFFLKDCFGIDKILADPTDRRIRAICDRFQCDLEIYSKVPKNGYMQYVIDISSPTLCALHSCTRALDSSMKWCLSPQLLRSTSSFTLPK